MWAADQPSPEFPASQWLGRGLGVGCGRGPSNSRLGSTVAKITGFPEGSMTGGAELTGWCWQPYG